MLLVALSGCSSDSDDATTDRPVTASQTSEPEPEPEQATDAEVTLAVEVRPEDLPRGFGTTNQFGEKGDLVDGYVTLDVCGGTFPSEALRTARHQVAFGARNGDSISTETVAYEPGGADQAMAELRSAIANCPRGFVNSSVEGQLDLKFRYEELPQEADWQDGAVAVRVTITPSNRNGRSFPGALIYQTRGDVMTAAYVFAGAEKSGKLAARIASLLSKRLETASPGATATS